MREVKSDWTVRWEERLVLKTKAILPHGRGTGMIWRRSRWALGRWWSLHPRGSGVRFRTATWSRLCCHRCRWKCHSVFSGVPSKSLPLAKSRVFSPKPCSLAKWAPDVSMYKTRARATSQTVSRCGLAVRRQAGKRKDLGSIQLRLSFLFRKVVVCGHCLVTLSITSY